MNKKAQINKFWIIGTSIMLFGIVIFLFLFVSVGLKQIIGEELIAPVVTTSLNATSGMISAGTVATVNNIETTWNTNFINYDIFFLLIFLIFVVELFYTASKVSIDNMFSFFGLITVGNILFLFVLSFVETVRDWLITNLYVNLFDLSLVSTPIIDIFVTNIVIISFILFLTCILIAALDWRQVKEKLIGFNSSERVEE